MKNSKILLLAVLGLMVLTSCKKGEDDPFLSLSSRDKRIVGTWKCTEFIAESFEEESYDTYTFTYEDKDEFNGTILTDYDNGVADDMWAYSQKISINKDGSYDMVETRDQSETKSTGRWWWKSDDKKKSMIDLGGVADVKRLTNKELVLHFSYEYNYSYSSQNSNYTEKGTHYGTYTYEKE